MKMTTVQGHEMTRYLRAVGKGSAMSPILWDHCIQRDRNREAESGGGGVFCLLVGAFLGTLNGAALTVIVLWFLGRL